VSGREGRWGFSKGEGKERGTTQKRKEVKRKNPSPYIIPLQGVNMEEENAHFRGIKREKARPYWGGKKVRNKRTSFLADKCFGQR